MKIILAIILVAFCQACSPDEPKTEQYVLPSIEQGESFCLSERVDYREALAASEFGIVYGEVLRVRFADAPLKSNTNPVRLFQDTASCELAEGRAVGGLAIELREVSSSGVEANGRFTIYVDAETYSSWSSRPVQLGPRIDWDGQGRIGPGMLVGGALNPGASADEGVVTSAFPMFEVVGGRLSPQAMTNGCFSLAEDYPLDEILQDHAAVDRLRLPAPDEVHPGTCFLPHSRPERCFTDGDGVCSSREVCDDGRCIPRPGLE